MKRIHDLILLVIGHGWKERDGERRFRVSLGLGELTAFEPKLAVVRLEVDRQVMKVHADFHGPQLIEYLAV
jgi:hypothetical protein